jgi:hypothetical protein
MEMVREFGFTSGRAFLLIFTGVVFKGVLIVAILMVAVLVGVIVGALGATLYFK